MVDEVMNSIRRPSTDLLTAENIPETSCRLTTNRIQNAAVLMQRTVVNHR